MSVGDFDAMPMMMAFPSINPNYDGNWDERFEFKGMTLRDYFAGQALAGVLANGDGKDDDQLLRVIIATDAYGYADAMLEARKAQP